MKKVIIGLLGLTVLFGVAFAQKVSVVNPDASTSWIIQNTYTIRWKTSPMPSPVRGQYAKIWLYQGDNKILDIADRTPNSGQFSWTIPATLPPGTNYYIRVGTFPNGVYANSKPFAIIAKTNLRSQAIAPIRRTGPEIAETRQPALRPAIQRPGPDIAVLDVKITLLETQLNTPGVEFPTDKVKIEAPIRNVGTKSIPQGSSLNILVEKNGQFFRGSVASDAIGSPGSEFTYQTTDSFPHGQLTEYRISVRPINGEPQTSNNSNSAVTDEFQLHPGRECDLSVSMVTCDKRWQQQGTQMRYYFYLEAKISNTGNGYPATGSHLKFILNDGTPIVSVPVSRHKLPGPHTYANLALGVSASQVPQGQSMVRAKIDPVDQEANVTNNTSSNAELIDNAAPALGDIVSITLDLPSIVGNQLSQVVKIINKQEQIFQLRLMFLKNDALAQEWKPLSLGPRASSQIAYHEGLVYGGGHNYRAILTTDLNSPQPPENLILATGEKHIGSMEIAQELLQNLLADPASGLPQQVRQQDGSIRVKDVKVEVSPSALAVHLSGKKIVDYWFDQEFTADIRLKPKIVDGKIALDVLDTSVSGGNTWQTILGSVFLPGIFQIIMAEINNAAADAIASWIQSAGTNLGTGFALFDNLLGIVLVQGALDVYF